MSNKPVLCIQVNEETQLRLFEELYLSMILGANFESESGPEIPLPTSLIIKFGGHLTPKKGSTWLLLTKKRATCDTSRLILAPTESPKRFPTRSFPRRCRRSPPVPLPVQRLPQPATAFPTPGAGCCFNATPSQGRAGGGEAGCGRARLGLDWCGVEAAAREAPIRCSVRARLAPVQDQRSRPVAPAVRPAAVADESGTSPQEIRGYAPGASICPAERPSNVPPPARSSSR